MSKMGNVDFIRVHPGAEADMEKMNEMLKARPDYIAGLQFAYEWQTDNRISFFYTHPETFTPEQQRQAVQLVEAVYAEFRAARSR